ncbi:MAG TPA: formate/nitrite transporter family protein [Ruminococcus flavefaciens]|nr:formate/nitrite transporter family protein [Ruminococcus flavefaciens]
MKKYIDLFLRAFITGTLIAVGGIAYLSCDNKYIGAFLFGTGLFVILNFNLALFTGKVGYAVENKPKYLFDLLIIWLGNFAGTVISAILVLCTRISGISEKAAALCETKTNDSPVSILILAFFCGMLMFIAADGYKIISNSVGKALTIFLPVVVFILSGFEHCIANMFYFSLAEAWTARSFSYLIIMSLGNALGGIFIPTIRKGFIK